MLSSCSSAGRLVGFLLFFLSLFFPPSLFGRDAPRKKLGSRTKRNFVNMNIEFKCVLPRNTGATMTKQNFVHMNNEFKYSIDSNTVEVIDKAIDSGFSVINDVFGFQNEEIVNKAVDSGCGIILVHRHPFSKNIHQKM